MRTVVLILSVAFMATSCAAKPSPTTGLPEDCRYMDVSPYSAFEGLEIHGEGKRKAAFSVEIADTWPRHQQGLMCRASLGEDKGMLFEFSDVRPRAFWMQNTLISLDIIYVRKDGTIVSIQKNAKPLDTTPLPSDGPASGVLEIEGGLSDKLGIKPGDRIFHPFFLTK